MKTAALIFSILFCFSQNAEAQFFKKLKNRTGEAVKEAVVNKTVEKGAQTAEKGMYNKLSSINSMDPTILPETYEFEWIYKLHMKAETGTFIQIYYLKPGAAYFGSKPEFKQIKTAVGMFMVADQELKTMTAFQNYNGKKMGQIRPYPGNIEGETGQESKNQFMKDMNYKKLDTKEILGYNCQGFQMENNEIKMTMYFTFDAPVSFNQVSGGDNLKTLPKGFDPKWLKGADNSLMMEMEFINKKKKKEVITMTCIGLENTPTTITVSDYEFMTQNGSAMKIADY